VVIRPDGIPEGSRVKGYQDYTVQDIRIKLHKTRYRLERWETPSGEAIIGQLPGDEAPFRRDPAHVRHLPIPTRHAHVTQPLILEQLREWGIEISADEISAIITEDKEAFHAEKEALLSVGLRYSRYVHVDDTGARHKGKNGYCTHIGNEQFAYFASTNSKSRINFLALLRAGHEDYVRGDEALAYMQQQKLPKAPRDGSPTTGSPATASVPSCWKPSPNGHDSTEPATKQRTGSISAIPRDVASSMSTINPLRPKKPSGSTHSTNTSETSSVDKTTDSTTQVSQHTDRRHTGPRREAAPVARTF
jgi:hypothetical protein